MVGISNQVEQLGSILAIWAHPDDETFCCGGLMATAVSNGQKVACLTATRGEVGKYDSLKPKPNELGAIRSKELEAALKILGVKRHLWLNYKDGRCNRENPDKAAKKIANYINKFNPDSILTFGPEGWTGHDDHCTVSTWVDKAVSISGKPITIYHIIHTPKHHEHYLGIADKSLNIFFNIDQPRLIPKEKCDIYYDLPAKIRGRKIKALKAHGTQTRELFEIFDEQFIEDAVGVEAFVKSK